MTAIAQKVQVVVTSIGTEVDIMINNNHYVFNYQDALKISDFIRFRAAESKRFARDDSMTFNIVADLSSVEAELNTHANLHEV